METTFMVCLTIALCFGMACITVSSIFEGRHKYLSDQPIFFDDPKAQQIGEIMMFDENIKDDEKVRLIELVLKG